MTTDVNQYLHSTTVVNVSVSHVSRIVPQNHIYCLATDLLPGGHPIHGMPTTWYSELIKKIKILKFKKKKFLQRNVTGLHKCHIIVKS